MTRTATDQHYIDRLNEDIGRLNRQLDRADEQYGRLLDRCIELNTTVQELKRGTVDAQGFFRRMTNKEG